jgi:GPH family glycoside/pentoside/hexuronide:cation symporter
MTIFAFGHLLPVDYSLAFMLVAGIGLGFTAAMPWAIVPDAVEYDYLLSGERTEGSFYGMWTFSIKIGQAVAMVITGVVLDLAGYVPDVAQSAKSLLGIRLLIGPIPAAIFLAAVLVLYFYPITRSRYEEIMIRIRELEARAGKGAGNE